ncbi:MAG: aminotransferase class I/II-fold pyridoxal phosphate-dependent enzyme [Gaiellaceae bacterium]|jgi:aromatic-L-amino-acid decarboxylase
MGGHESDDPLGLDSQTMRELGYRTVDLLVERLERERGGPPLRRATPTEMRGRLHGPPPEQPEPFGEILQRLERDVLPFASRDGHPRFFGFVPFAGTWPGALGDLIASGSNLYAGSWMESAGASQVELEVLGWFKDWIGYPPDAAGSLVSGGSAGNITALACAREALAGPMRDDLVLYVSDQAHSSIARAARMLGFRPEQVRVLPSDERFRLAPETLRAAITADLARGLTPFSAVAQGGATNTGSVDPLDRLAEVCREHGAWLHVDAAYGGFAALADPGLLPGLAHADSVTLDPHKWLYQPFECGCVLVRDGQALRNAFEILPDYLRDAEADAQEVNFCDLGLQLTRSARALKIWVSLRYFGLEAFRQAIRRSLEVAAAAARRVEESRTLELMAPPSLGVVCFRRGDLDEASNAGLVSALERSGTGLISTTRLHGRFALRMCVLNHQSTPEDVEDVLAFLETAEPQAPEPARERHPSIVSAWPGLPQADLPSLRELPIFAGLEPGQAAQVAARASLREIAAGEPVIEQWDLGAEFFVIVEGTATVTVDGQQARELGRGDFFGELRALEWGAGYAYPRLASVLASSPLRLLVFPEGVLAQLVERYPALDRVIREAVAERLQRHS